MSLNQKKIIMSPYYNNKYAIDNQIKLKNKKELSNISNITNNKNIKKNLSKFSNKNSSNNIISEYLSPNIDNKLQKKRENDKDKIIIKTSLIKPKKEKSDKIQKDIDKYHINFELLANAGITKDININMTFI